MRCVLLLCLAASAAFAQTLKQREPSPKAKGKLYAWKTKGGFEYAYRLPKSFSAKKRATLLIIFQGKDHEASTGITHYVSKRFRHDDVFLYPGRPEAISGGGARGSLEYVPKPVDARIVHGIHMGFRKLFKVRTTVLYGVGKGASFALYYAGMYPDDVHGVLAEAGPVWKGTEITKEQRHQSILFMKFAGDPQASLADVRKTVELYRKKGLPKLHFSVVHETFERRDGRWWTRGALPAVLGVRLAWCEGMSTGNPKRLAAIYKQAARVEDHRYYDYAAIYQLAGKCEKKRTVAGIEKLAAQHLAAIRASLGSNETRDLDGKEWLGHYLAFAHGFAGIPACEELVKEWQPHLQRHADNARDLLPTWQDQRDKDAQAAFWACAEIMRKACLEPALYTHPMVTDLEKWRKESDKFAIERKDLDVYERYRAASAQGTAAYHALNARFRP